MKPPSRSQLLRPHLPEEALHGLPGQVARTLSEQTGADPATILTMFLAAFGNSIGRQPHIWFGGAEQSSNLFVLIVGEWARGRKGTAWGAVKRLMLDADPDWASYCVESGVQSPEALVDSLHDGITDLDPRMLLLEAEFARLIQAMERARNFGAELRKAYDGEPLSRRKVGKTHQRSTKHHISLLGMITPGELIALSKLTGGLESRMLYVFSAPGKQPKRIDPFRRDDSMQELASAVRAALDYSTDVILSSTDPISAELAMMRTVPPTAEFYVEEGVWTSDIEDELDELTDKIGEDYARYTVRGATHIIRLALLYALADQSPEIQAPHLRAAMALWEFCAWSARRIFSVPASPEPRVNPRKASQVYDYLLEAYPDWVAKTEIDNIVLSRNSKGSEVDVITADLLEQGIIETRKLKPRGRGRPRTEYRAKAD